MRLYALASALSPLAKYSEVNAVPNLPLTRFFDLANLSTLDRGFRNVESWTHGLDGVGLRRSERDILSLGRLVLNKPRFPAIYCMAFLRFPAVTLLVGCLAVSPGC